MERREFIKAVGVALVSSPSTLTLKKPAGTPLKAVETFDAKRPMGASVDFKDRSEATVATAREVLYADARGRLPRGTKFYVVDGGERHIWLEGRPTRVDSIGWLYSPTPLQEPTKARVIAEVTA